MKWIRPLLLVSIVFPLVAQANDAWWFDIEVILFDRNISLAELKEQFEQDDSLTASNADIDLIGEYLRPDISWLKQGLTTCGVPDNPLWTPAPTIEEILDNYQQWQSTQQATSTSLPVDSTETQTDPYAALDELTATSDDDMPASYANNDQALSEGVSTPLPQDTAPVEVNPGEIAGYWIEFSGINDTPAVSVPAFKDCEPPFQWLSYNGSTWQTHFSDNHLPMPEHIPEFLDGNDWPRSPNAHILSYDALALKKLSRQIRQSRGLNRLLHIAWRQKVEFGQDKAQSVRIIAGDNYADGFDLNGLALRSPTAASKENAEGGQTENTNLPSPQPQADIFSVLEEQLENPRNISFSSMLAAVKDNEASPLMPIENAGTLEPEPIWQIDGYLKVFLKYINGVPYLHIDSEMAYRQPIPVNVEAIGEGEPPQYKLVSVPFRQLRRVISKQLHYFDHPLFGMVVEIRRYERPQGE